MHFCQDELFMIMMAVQNGPRNILRYIVNIFKSLAPSPDHWVDGDMRTWRNSKRDMVSLKWVKDQKRWTHEVRDDHR